MSESKSSLITNALKQKIRLFAQFGGQGVAYLSELRNLYLESLKLDAECKTRISAQALIAKADVILKEQSNSLEARILGFYKEPLELLQWIQEEDSTPSEEYLSSAPVSMALIFLTQVCQYIQSAKKLFPNASNFVDSFRQVWTGVTGHSQGIVAAALVASSRDDTTFFENSIKFLIYQFWLGARLQQVYNSYGNFHLEESEISPMLNINGLAFEVLSKVVERVNKTLQQNDQVTIALVNGVRNFVCSGKEDSLKILLNSLQQIQAKPEEDQSRVAFSKRKHEFRTSFLPISLPFHCPLMKPAISLIMGDLVRLNLSEFLKKSDLKLPLRSTVDGSDLSLKQEGSLLEELATLQAVQPVNWIKCINNSTNNITHVIDFGPGITGLLTARIKEGLGVQAIQANLQQSSFTQLLSNKYLFDPELEPVFAIDYRNFLPKVCRIPSGDIVIDNKFSRVMGKPPIMIAGMTPTTANEKIVVAFTNAGYHGELAGGGQATPEIFRNRIHNILSELKPGEGIHVNSLYLNPKLWSFQFAICVELRSQGFPIDSITIGAGVPSLEKANEIIKSMQKAGMTVIGFKPGSVNSIKQVIEIAQHNPTMNILLQWTGGRAGGHHSFEDAHDPILQTYRDIRNCSNIILIMGSGIGDSKEALKYLKGTWSQSLNHGVMPFDGVLMGSRVMSCLEASTSEKAKELLVKTPGVNEEKEWEKSYDGSVGGVITVISELGEPIHVVANRATLLWKELDTKYFSLPPQKLVPELEKNRDYIVKRLNSDYQKLYFGIIKEQKQIHLTEMTYSEVAERMIELMFINGSWVHDTFKKRLVAFLQRIEERYSLRSSTFKSMLTPDHLERLNLEPKTVISAVFQKFPQAISQILSPEDVDYFLHICKNLGKPVNFVPVIDKDLSFWFKKDSLWYSECLEIVPQEDPQRVMILQSPVTVKSITKANEPIGEFLSNMEKEIIADITRTTSPSDSQTGTWWSSLLSASNILHFKKRRENYFARIVARSDVEEVMKENQLEKVFIYEKKNSSKPSLIVEASVENKETIIRATFMHRRANEDVPLTITYSLLPRKSYSPVHLRSSPSEFNLLVKKFYAKLWLSDPSIDLSKLSVKDTIVTTKKIHLNEIDRFCRSIGRSEISSENNKIAPIDYTVVVAWEALSCGLFVKEIDADLLDLLHLSYGYKILGNPEDSCLTEGETITIKMRVTEISNLQNGKRVSVIGTLHKSENSSPILEITSQFFFRGQYSSVDGNFINKKIQRLVEIKDKKVLAAIMSRNWIKLGENSLDIGDKLIFEVSSTRRGITLDERSFSSSETTGNIYLMGELTLDKREKVGEVNFKSEKRMTKDPVEHFLERHGRSVDNVHIFENGGYSLAENIDMRAVSVMESELYGEASGDLNPIHYNSNIAFLAGLENTIVHGMWTAARARNLVDTVLNRGCDRKKSYEVKSCNIQFVDKIPQLEKLSAKIVHVGLKNGLKMIDVEIKNDKMSTVLKCSVEATQPNTAYMFTGQGSAEIGMGMDLYASSTVAKQIWDRAEKHMLENYGFSLLDIIRRNPKEVTINFRSENGRKIREKYTSLKQKVKQGDREVVVQLFHDIRDTTDTYTFTHPQGLLFQTQFQQPALTLVEKASFEDLKARGLVPIDAMFAGHSLGEYSAISSVANVLRIEELVELVFLRGITMQNCVKRNEQGLSPFGMIAVNPQRVGSFFTPKDLHSLVDLISKTSGLILQVVNYNVENWQYIVTGYNSNLETLRIALNFIKENPTRLEEILNVVTSTLAKYPDPSNIFTLNQGVATVPLSGIDVPFHSQYLLPEVPQFRNYLLKTLDPKRVDIKLLEGKYVPNLTPTPFEVSTAYIDDIIKVTNGASLLKDLLQSRKFDLEKYEDKQLLGYFILVELLAFQFASPVRWIETQDVFLRKEMKRFIEIGPSTTLAGMAKRTLQLVTKYPQVFPPREILSYKSDRDAIYYNVMQSVAPTKSIDKKKKVKEEPKKQEVQKLPETIQVSAPVSSSDRVTSDTPALQSLDVIKSLLSIKLKKKLDEIQNESTIKDLVGGKSAIQNEIIGDFQKEFGSEPEGAATMSLSQLSQQWSGYKNLGAISNSLISKMIGTKLAPGFGMGEIKDYLNKEHGLDSHQTDAVIVHGLTMEPESRLDEIKTKEWLSSVSQNFANVKGKHLAVRSKMGSSSTKVQVVDSEALMAFQKRLDQFIRNELENSANYLNEDLKKDYFRAENSEVLRKSLEKELKNISEELGESFREGIKPIFDPRKIRKYNCWWAWGRHEAASLFYDTIRTNPANYDIQYCEKVYSLTNRGTDELLKIVQEFGKKAAEYGNQRVARHINNLAIQVSEHLKHPSYFRIMGGPHTAPITEVTPEGRIVYKEVERETARNFGEFITEMQRGYALNVRTKRSKLRSEKAPVKKRVPYLFCRFGRSEDPTDFDPNVTRLYYNSMEQMGALGLTFNKKVVLITGCGRGSIGFELIKGLLQGGATVICTTSKAEKSTFDNFQKIYQEFGGKNSMLHVVPFNAASLQDVNNLIDHVYNHLNIKDIDFLIPFAAISENGRDVSGIDSTSELAHRMMLTNVIRMIGRVRSVKESKKLSSSPTIVILPLSPNHGVFGGDGLYSESKASLEILFNKIESEGWKDYISIVGAVIGWTRGTGLMEGNNMVASEVEKLGLRTFSQKEMAIAILALMGDTFSQAAMSAPVWADLTGGMKMVPNLNTVVSQIRADFMEKAELLRSAFSENEIEKSLIVEKEISTAVLTPRANFDSFAFPTLPSDSQLKNLPKLEGMIDLDKTVGFGEIGPWGNRRTRWEIEHRGEFSMEGCIELAHIMGLIQYHNGVLPSGQNYIGWIDVATKSPVRDIDVKEIYEPVILKKCGIREIEPHLMEGYNPHSKNFLHEVALTHDMPVMEVFSEQESEQYKLMHGDKVNVFSDHGKFFVQFKKGATLFIPRALKFDRFVAGQIPSTWEASRYGIPQEIINQVDRVTLFNLVSTCEALISSGILDPYELYEYVHISEVGNTTGSGIGGLNSIRRTFRERFIEKSIQSDILQETFINVIPAWINMLLFGSAGPIKIPVGACATSAISVELGVDTIRSGKARFVIVGGCDDISEESSYEFGMMKATNNSEEDMRDGRTPSEMSRPATETRHGFIESHGSGTQILTTAELALKMGLPIYSIVALTNTSSDTIGRSVPAPGRGILTTARESKSSFESPLLDLEYRREQLFSELQRIDSWAKEQSEKKSDPEFQKFINQQAEKRKKSAKSNWSNDFYVAESSIAPLKGALGVWGLTIDDLGVVSMHGTSTQANDKNESEVIQAQMSHLGRTKGNILFTILQKYLTGHPKGAAAAWMMNGLIQTLLSGIVPGNKNADNIDQQLEKNDYLVWTNKSVHTVGLKAGLLKSFGFGQASAEILLIHPDYLYSSLSRDELAAYTSKRSIREKKAISTEWKIITDKENLVRIKNEAVYNQVDESKVFLDPLARAQKTSDGSWKFSQSTTPSVPEIPKKIPTPETAKKESNENIATSAKSLEVMMKQFAESMRGGQDKGIGVDVQLVNEVNMSDPTFLQRNFTENEIQYCLNACSDLARKDRLAGRFAAKEAIIKAITTSIGDREKHKNPIWSGSGSALKDIEVLPTEVGAPVVKLRGHVETVAKTLGIQDVKVTISHSGDYAVAQAVVK